MEGAAATAGNRFMKHWVVGALKRIFCSYILHLSVLTNNCCPYKPPEGYL